MPPTRFVTLAVLTLSVAGSTAAARAASVASPEPRAAVSAPAAPRAEELYSLRARRRFAAYMRMRLLELRSAGLAHAADVIERRLPIDDLVPQPLARVSPPPR